MVKQAVGERRRHIRAKRVLSVEFKLVKSQRKNTDRSWSLSTTQDISSGNISFYTDQEYRSGDILNLHIIMPGVWDIYKGYGKVVRVERKESGVCFLIAVKFIEKEQINKNFRTYPSVKKSRARKRL